MNRINLGAPVTDIYGVGQSYAYILSNLGINTIRDLIYYFPYRYEDSTNIATIDMLNAIEPLTIEVTVESIKNIRTRNRKTLTQAHVYDDTGDIDVIWFNQQFLTKNIKSDDILLLRGKLNNNSSHPQLYSPEYEVLHKEESTHLGRITPVYNLTEGIKQKWLRAKIKLVFDKYSYLIEDLKDNLSEQIKKKYNLIDLQLAIKNIHFPNNFQELEQSKKRLGFDELLQIQILLEKQRQQRLQFKGIPLAIDNKIIKKFISNLEFKPTNAQTRAIDEISKDLKRSIPMNRLLEGDVGSGKTLVAIVSTLLTVKSGYQVAIMAPTAVLARQHYDSFKNMLGQYGINIELITGDHKNKSPKTDIFIGTQALLFRKHQIFKKLGLIIVDEQHRFGVEQRDEIMKFIQSSGKSITPHTLTMTATPIPRSIALAIFGDLDISVLNELPGMRIPTETYVVPENKRKDSFKWISQKISDGNVCFWICPLIEESDKLEAKAVKVEFEHLKKIFPKHKIEMIHGKVPAKEKDEILNRFDHRKTKILVSTSVVEVGIDIAEANLIVIEGAERFGLAQLHQLRGRVGRRDKPSWCLLFLTNKKDMESNEFGTKNYSRALDRLQFFAKTNDGLKLAEYDMQSRGPGEIYGTRQSGIPNLKIARIDDINLIKTTRDAAKELVHY